MAVERVGKQFFADAARDSASSIAAKPARAKVGLVHLDDEGAAARRVAVMMGVEVPCSVCDESLRQRLEALGGAEPGEAVGEIA